MAKDPYWNSVVLAMHMDDTGLTDLKGHAVTLTGNVARSSTQSKFGGYAAYFDGNGDYLTIPASADFTFGSGDFTIEAWVFPTVSNKWQEIVGQWTNSYDNGWGLYLTNGNKVALLCKSGSTDYSLYTTETVPANTWTHLCAFRIADTAYLAINGVIVATKTGVQAVSYGNAAAGVKVGSAWATVTDYFTGYIDDLRITKGVARYTSDFSVPTEAFPNRPMQLSGTVKDSSGNFAARTVRAYKRSTGALSDSDTSSASDGAFTLDAADGTAHYVICFDDDLNENALIFDNLIPV